MKQLKNINDTSQELLVYRYGYGVRLVRPDQAKNTRGFSTKHTIQSLFNLDLSIYFLDYESRIENTNQTNLEVCGLDSLKQGVGKTAFDISQTTFSKNLIQNDQSVLIKSKACFFDECILKHGGTSYGLSLKIPWYNNDFKTIGILGFSIISEIHSLAKSLATIQSIGLFDTLKPSSNFLSECFVNNVYFTRREKIILHHVIRGNSAYTIGNMLNISQRTVETHFHNIKIKLGVRSKAEVIQKIMDEKWLM